MKKEKILTKVARARVSEGLYSKLQSYAIENNCVSSDVVRNALEFFLQHSATNHCNKIKRA